MLGCHETVEDEETEIYSKGGEGMSKKILTIDGGGIKGLFAASFLAHIEAQCGGHIADYFDMIAGTSTGGIIAAALALGIPAKDIQKFYEEKGLEIFPKGKYFHFTRGKYGRTSLERILREVFGDNVLGNCQTRLLVPAYNIENRKTRVFKTQHAQGLCFDNEVSIVECLLATTAAPVYFSPYRMQGGVFIDGGVGANNPSLIALTEGITRCQWNLHEICLLSVGGVKEPGKTTGNERMGMLDALKIQRCFMEAESQYVENICKLLLEKGHYLRVNQEALRNQVSLDKVSRVSMQALSNWGENQAMNNIAIVKDLFFRQKKDEITFYS